MNCPKCGGQMWDNRATKRNPKQPDYKCKNPTCAEAVWERNAQNGSNGQTHAQAPSVAPNAGLVLDAMFYHCLVSAIKMCDKAFAPADQANVADYSTDNAVNIATTLFIARTRDKTGILNAEKPKAAPPPPPPPPVAPVMAYAPLDDSDLPF